MCPDNQEAVGWSRLSYPNRTVWRLSNRPVAEAGKPTVTWGGMVTGIWYQIMTWSWHSHIERTASVAMSILFTFFVMKSLWRAILIYATSRCPTYFAITVGSNRHLSNVYKVKPMHVNKCSWRLSGCLALPRPKRGGTALINPTLSGSKRIIKSFFWKSMSWT